MIPVHQRLKGGISKCGLLFFHGPWTPFLGSGHQKTTLPRPSLVPSLQFCGTLLSTPKL